MNDADKLLPLRRNRVRRGELGCPDERLQRTPKVVADGRQDELEAIEATSLGEPSTPSRVTRESDRHGAERQEDRRNNERADRERAEVDDRLFHAVAKLELARDRVFCQLAPGGRRLFTDIEDAADGHPAVFELLGRVEEHLYGLLRRLEALVVQHLLLD